MQIYDVMMDKRIDDPVFLTQRYKFGDLLTKNGLTGEGAEIGVYQGEFSMFVRSRWNGKMMFLIDRWEHVDGYRDIMNKKQSVQNSNFQAVLEKFKDDSGVSIFRMDSMEAVGRFGDGDLDWVYIDADHSYNACKADIEEWSKKVRIGGIVAGHDYLDGTYSIGEFGVKSAVDEYVGKHGYKLMLSGDHKNKFRTWYFVKDH